MKKPVKMMETIVATMKKGERTMKKIMGIMVTVVVVAMLTCGCKAMEGNVTDDLADAAYQAEAEVRQLKIDTNDEAFWTDADRAAEEIKDILEVGRDFLIEFRVESENTTALVESNAMHLDYINDVWRNLVVDQLVYGLATSDPVVNIHKSGGTVRITGLIARFAYVDTFDSETKYFSLMDNDGNGHWNYGGQGKIFFTEDKQAAVTDSEGNRLEGIIFDAIRNVEIVPIDENSVGDDMTMSGYKDLCS